MTTTAVLQLQRGVESKGSRAGQHSSEAHTKDAGVQRGREGQTNQSMERREKGEMRKGGWGGGTIQNPRGGGGACMDR